MTNERKPDFSKVEGTVRGTTGEVPETAKPDFSKVQGTVRGISDEGKAVEIPEKPDFSQVTGTVRGEGLPPESRTYTVEKLSLIHI